MWGLEEGPTEHLDFWNIYHLKWGIKNWKTKETIALQTSFS